MKRLKLSAIIFLTIQIYALGQPTANDQALSQPAANARMLKLYGEDRIEAVFVQLLRQEEYAWFTEIHGPDIPYNYFLLPTVHLKNQKEYAFDKEFINFIDLNRIDSVAHFFVLNQNQEVIAQVDRFDSSYYLSAPLFNVDKRYKKLMKKLSDDNGFVFRLPHFGHEWWILKDDCLLVYDQRKLVEANRYLKKNFNEEFF